MIYIEWLALIIQLCVHNLTGFAVSVKSRLKERVADQIDNKKICSLNPSFIRQYDRKQKKLSFRKY